MNFEHFHQFVNASNENDTVKACVHNLINLFEAYCNEHPGITYQEVKAVFLPIIKRMEESNR